MRFAGSGAIASLSFCLEPLPGNKSDKPNSAALPISVIPFTPFFIRSKPGSALNSFEVVIKNELLSKLGGLLGSFRFFKVYALGLKNAEEILRTSVIARCRRR